MVHIVEFFKSKTFLITVLFQIAGPYLIGFGNWTNVIQYVSGFCMAYALWKFEKHLNLLHTHLKKGS